MSAADLPPLVKPVARVIDLVDPASQELYGTSLEEARDSLRDMGSLAEHLLNSGRWLEERVDTLIADILACGPSAVPAAA